MKAEVKIPEEYPFFLYRNKQSSIPLLWVLALVLYLPSKISIISTSSLALQQDHFYETDVESRQQFDNPSHGITIRCLNNNLKSASNNLLSMEKIDKMQSKHHRRHSSSLSVTLASSKFAEGKENRIKKAEQRQAARRCSIDRGFLAEINGHPEGLANFLFQHQNETIQSIKSYIISDKKMFENYSRAEIKNKDFIKMKKVPIRKYYRFLQKIGEGSYGNVYRAMEMKSKDIRAIKSIKQKIMPDEKRNELMTQIQILRELDHPNIIKMFQVYEDKSLYHVVTEYCVGGSIIDFVVTRKKYSQKIVRIIMQQLLSALNYIHMLNVVHRDLKLENLVFLNFVNENTNANDIDVKLIDFGTARKIKGKLNKCKGLVGTTSYMAPEIIDNYFNEKCDIWSAGVILYILLIGRSPFKCASKQDTLKKIKNHELTFADPEWANISKQSIDLLKKMLIKDPEKRISASQALCHPWFQQVKSGKNLFLQNKDLVSNLSKYYRGNNFISKIESYLTFVKVNQEQRKKISEMFRLLDTNNDGTIEVQELKYAYSQIEDQQNIAEIQYIVSKIDKNKSGRIDLSEFTAAMYDRKKLFIKEYLVEAFEYFDVDGTGYLEKKQLHTLLEGCQKDEIQEILKEIDINRDNRISKEEFLDYLLKRNFLFDKK